jgi:hypothetical protein
MRELTALEAANRHVFMENGFLTYEEQERLRMSIAAEKQEFLTKIRNVIADERKPAAEKPITKVAARKRK